MAPDPLVRQLVDRLLDSDATPEDVCGPYPELLPAVRIRWQRVRRLRGDLDDYFPPEGSDPPADDAALPQVPGYRVECLLGRGGMGVAYKARDLSLDRDVAVKLLQDRYPADSPIRRFTDEARITAQLQHPGIPPVHQVGTLPDGRPFLAMKLIDGRTLAALLGDCPDTAADRGRFVAKFEQICQAVGYAHAHNVIHRDLKPSNVMVGAFGEVQVMDWGLAKVLTARGRPPGPPDTAPDTAAGTAIRSARDADQETLAGSRLGTPAYMPPEQAIGAVDRIDARSDVFSLGGILCAVLTGRPPYVADTAEATSQLAARARLDDAHARLAACGAEPELVALCLRCLAPEPDDRPRDAGEVAAAVTALRAAAEERARRAELDRVRVAEQGKRRRVLLTASGATVVVLLAGLTVSLWQTRRAAQERDDKDKALAGEQKAGEVTMAALRDLTDDVVEYELARDTHLTEESKEFLRKIIKHFESFAVITADDAASRAIRAEGHARVGLMRHRLGELHDAETAYRTALEIQTQLAADFPTRPDIRQELARSHNNLGVLLRDTDRLEEAEAVHGTALEFQTQLAADFPARPEFRRELARSHNNLGVLLRSTGRLKEAEAAHGTALAIREQLAADLPTHPEFRQELARSHHSLGNLLDSAGRPKEAEAAYGAALDLQKHLVADFPTQPEFRQERAASHNNLGILLEATGRLKEAEAAYGAALATRKQLAADFAARPEFRQQLALSHITLGNLLLSTGRLKEAEAASGTALDLQKRLAADFPARPEFRQELARSHNILGVLFRDTGRLKEAEAAYRAALDLQKQLAADFPTRPACRRELATTYNSLGNLLRDTGRPKEAEAAYMAALDLQKQPAADFSTGPEFRRDLARTHNNLGILLHSTGRPKEAEEAYRAALALQKQLAADFPTHLEFRRDLARSHLNLANLLNSTGRPKEAEAAHGDALDLRKQLAADFPTRPEFRQQLALSHHNLGILLLSTGRLKEAEAANGAALAIRKQLAADFPARPEFRQELASSHNILGILLRDTDRLKEAEAAYRTALELQKLLAADFPSRPEFREELARSHNNLGILLRDTGRLKETEAAYGAALDLLRQLAAEFPSQPDRRNELAGNCVNLAVLCNQRRDFRAAKAYLEEARPHHQAALNANPRHPIYRQFLRNNLWTLARANAGLLDQESAVQVAETIRDLGWDPPGNAYDAARALAQCIRLAAKHDELGAAQREQAAQFYGDAAMKLLRDAVGKGYKDVAHMKKDTDLKPLQQRDDFRTLVAELEGKGK